MDSGRILARVGVMRLPVSLVAAIVFHATPAFAGPIDDLQPGEWYEAPSSHAAAVEPMPTPVGDTGPSAVISAWGSAIYDEVGDRLILWGGGHTDYSGNEVYAFDLATLSWSLLAGPSTDVGGSEESGYYPDGLPRARHTYDYIVYLPAFGRFCSFGGAGMYPSGQMNTQNTDCFNLTTQKWERYAATIILGENIGAFSALDPTTGHSWIHGTAGDSTLAEFDPVANTWTAHGTTWTENAYFSYSLTAAIDPTRRLLVAVGGGAAYSWDLTQPASVAAVALTPGGDLTAQQVGSPGFVYDPVVDKFVAWAGGTDVYTLDPATWTWSHTATASTNTVTPTAAATNGTFGRFRYIPSKNAFITVSAMDGDVYVYKLSAGDGTPVDAGVPPPPQDSGTGPSNDGGSAAGPEGGSGASPDGGPAASTDGGKGAPSSDSGTSPASGDQPTAGNPAQGGGCACRVTSSPRDDSALGIMLLATSLLAAMSRSRGNGREASVDPARH
jgi:hypothetical protein